MVRASHSGPAKRMSYRLVIFDFDGTLADSLGWLSGALQASAVELGFGSANGLDLQALRSHGPREVMRRLGLPAWRIPRLAASMKAAMSRDIDRISLFPGVDGLLRGLAAAGIAQAIVSSNSQENVLRVLGAQNAALVQYLEADVPLLGKRGRFRRILRRGGFRREQVLCIGDELRDLDAAEGEGLAFGAVSWGYATAEALAARTPAVLFTRLEEILAYATR